MTTASHRTGQVLLPGQTAAPDGPVDLVGNWSMHFGFRRDLAAFARAVGRTPVEDRATWRALDRRWQVFATILHNHHTGEVSGIWPLLLERADAAGDADARTVVEAMAAEHAGIDSLLGACGAGFRRLAAVSDAGAREALAVDLAATADHLGGHLAHEERDGMRVVQEYLTQADWDRITEEDFVQPLPRRELLLTAAWVLHELPRDAVARLRSEAHGPMLLALWRLFLRRPFERRERRAFRYA